MANSTAKAFSIMRALRRNLTLRFPATYVFTDSVDTDGNPVLQVAQDATPATSEQIVLFRIKPESLLFVNSLGTAQENFVPHDLEVVTETGAVANTTYLNATNAAIVHTESAKTGCIYKFYMSANGAVPTALDFTDANLKGTFNPEIYHKLTAQ